MTSVTAAHEKAQHQQRKGKGRSRAGERDHPVPGTALRDRPRAGLLRDLARRRAAASVHRMVAGHPGRLERRLDPLHPAGGLRSYRIARRTRPRGTHGPGRAGRTSPGGPGHAGPGWPAHRGGRRRPEPARRRGLAARGRRRLRDRRAVPGLPVGREPGPAAGQPRAARALPRRLGRQRAADPARRRPPAGRGAAGAGHQRGHVRVLLRGRRPGDRRRRAPDGRRPRAGAGRLAHVHGGSGGGVLAPAVRCPAAARAGPGWPGCSARPG